MLLLQVQLKMTTFLLGDGSQNADADSSLRRGGPSPEPGWMHGACLSKSLEHVLNCETVTSIAPHCTLAPSLLHMPAVFMGSETGQLFDFDEADSESTCSARD